MSITKPVLLVLGMPGSGKTTISRALAEALGVPHRSVGDVLRTGRAMDQQPPSEEDPATWFLEQELQRIVKDTVRGIILDFSPVTHGGAELLTRMLERQGFNIRSVVYVKTTEQIAEDRYCARGHRSGDGEEDLRTLFARRIAQEFQPFTLPMIRDASEKDQLFTLENNADKAKLDEDIALLVNEVRATWSE